MSDLKHDIEKYWNGELSPAEMHALEKRALSDPFLAEALEGAGTISPTDLSSDLRALRNELHENNKPATTIWVWAGRIAAGIAITALVAILVFDDGTKSDQLAYSDKPIPDKTTETKEERADFDEQESSAPAEPEEEKKLRDDRGRSAKKSDVGGTGPVETLEQEEPIAEEIIIPEPAFAEEKPPSMGAVRKLEKPSNYVQGFVVDAEDGKGLPGVNVTIKGTNIGTITDEEGNYQIRMDSLNAGLVFSFIGFESKEIIPGAVNGVNVALEPDISELSEVVVVGYGAARDPSLIDPPTIEMAEPAGGKKAFKQYMVQNLRYPEQALNHKVEGKVTVQFTIETNGSLSDFRVVKGLGYGCDDEVIRLIKSGPKWAPTKRNHEPIRDKVKVRLRFSLPKNQK